MLLSTAVPVNAQTSDPIDLGPDVSADEALPACEELVLRMRQAVLAGDHWFDALLDAINRWRQPVERVGDRTFQYLIFGEAFDWLLLAERLLDEMPDLVHWRERDALIFENRWPLDLDDAEFSDRIGVAKHSAHLNYLYGVLVEEALQLCIEEEIHKESRSRAWGQDSRVDETMYERVYGKPRIELFAQYYEETGTFLRGDISLTEWKTFTYWLFKQRLKRQDKARVASDTRKGLAQLTRMELAVGERRFRSHGPALTEADFAERYA